jgi:glyoxylase-like metal-dependent hydrolase (beta-lactamase superfamily II)
MEHERVELAQPHYGGVNAYRIGDTLVDTGHVFPESRRLLREALEGPLAGIDRVVLTHPHIDHVGGSMTVPEVTDLPHVVYEGADDLIRNYETYLHEAREEMAALSSGLYEGDPEPDNTYFPTDIDYATDEVAIERVVGHGDTVRVGPYDCTAVHTPGHSHQHMTLHHEGSDAMLSGDLISTNGHFMYGPIHWDIGEYKTGLRRVRDLDPARLLPGHGGPMADPRGRAEDALEKAERAETAILDALDEHGTLAAHELAVEALGAGENTVQFLSNVASAYAVHLADRGLITVERRPYVVASPA